MRFLGFEKDFYKSLLALTLPAIVQFFLFHLLNLSDNWMVASLGSLPLAGVALSNKITLVMSVLIFGIANGVAVFTAQVYSIKDYKSIHKAYSYLIIRSFVSSFIFFIIAFFFTPRIISFMTNDPQIIEIASLYLPLASISYMPMALSSAISWLMRSFQEARVPLYATVIAVILNIVCNYIFMFVLNMGVVGAALGTVIARFVELTYLIFKSQSEKLRILLGFRAFFDGLSGVTREFKRKLLSLVVPVATNELLWALSISTLEIVYVEINPKEYANYVIASGAAEFSYFVFHALAISCGIFLGNQAKKGKEVLAQMGSGLVKLGAMFSLVNMCLVLLLSFIIPPLFPNLDDPYLIGTFLRVIAVFTVFNLMSLMMNIAILRAGGDVIFALVVDSAPQWLISIPMAFFISHYFNSSIKDIYILVASVEFCKFLIFFWRVKSQKWIKSTVALEQAITRHGKDIHP